MNCRECGSIVIDVLLREGAREDAVRIEDHLAGCEPCRRERDELRAALDAYKTVPDVEAGPELDRALRKLVPAKERKGSAVIKLTWWQNTVMWSVASAACLVFVVWLAQYSLPSTTPSKILIEGAIPDEAGDAAQPVELAHDQAAITNGRTIEFASPEDIPIALPVVIDVEKLLPDNVLCQYLVSDDELMTLARLGVREEEGKAGLLEAPAGLLAKRTARDREDLVYTYLGHGTQAHVSFGLAWLASRQDNSGAWRDGGEISLETTSLVLLAFLTDGSSHVSGAYRENVLRGITYLRSCQSTDGVFAPDDPRFMTAQTLATLVLVEDYLLSSDDALLEPAATAIRVILASQRADGGWGLGPSAGKSDAFVTGWLVMLLKEARTAGFEVPEESLKGATVWFHKATDYKGRVGRSAEKDFPRGEYHGSTAVGLFAKQLLGWPRTHKSLGQAEKILGGRLPAWDRRENIDLTYVYFGTMAMFQRGGAAWREWNDHLKDAFMFKQIARGREIGSWPGVRHAGRRSDRVYSTAMSILTLQVYYRYPILSD